MAIGFTDEDYRSYINRYLSERLDPSIRGSVAPTIYGIIIPFAVRILPLSRA